MLDGRRNSAATKNETAINELRAQLSEGLARLDQLTVGLQVVQEFLWPTWCRANRTTRLCPPPTTVPIQGVTAESEPLC